MLHSDSSRVLSGLNMSASSQDRQALKNAIFAITGVANPPRSELNRVAQEASEIAKRDRSWTGSYLYNLMRGYGGYNLTTDLLNALLLLADNSSLRGTTAVTVRSHSGAITPGALVLGKSRRCARRRCVVRFVPSHAQKYCSVECRTRIQKFRQRRKRKGW